MTDSGDADLVGLVRAGDPSAFAALYRAHAPAVYRVARERVPLLEAATDVVQETFARALANLDKLREPDRFRPWILSIARHAANFRQQGEGARILLKEVEDPRRFGVPEIRGSQIVRIDEKPAVPASNYAVTGIYMYDAEVFDIIKTLRPSGRGELEITDVNNEYIRKGKMAYDVLEGWWTDAGTFDSLLRASNLVARNGQQGNQTLMADRQERK